MRMDTVASGGAKAARNGFGMMKIRQNIQPAEAASPEMKEQLLTHLPAKEPAWTKSSIPPKRSVWRGRGRPEKAFSQKLTMMTGPRTSDPSATLRLRARSQLNVAP